MIIVSLGNKAEATISKTGRLLLCQRHQQGFMIDYVDLGPATAQNIEAVQDSLGKLYKHAVPEEKAA